MKKYIIITVISAIVISGIVYSIVYVPEFSDFFKNLISRKSEVLENPVQEVEEVALRQTETLANLTITSADNFKNVKFGDLNLKVSSNYKVQETEERIRLTIDEFNEIQGFYYPITSKPRNAIDVVGYESELLKNTYSLSKKSNIPDEFVRDVFNLSLGATVQDSIEGQVITYSVRDYLTTKDINMSGYFFDSEVLDRYKIIVLTTNKLYIFNARVLSENFLNIQKTFYNLEKVN